MNATLEALQNSLMVEGILYKEHTIAPSAERLNETRRDLLTQIREIGKSGDLSLIVGAEKTIVANELERHANSKGMVSSLSAALVEMDAIERLLGRVDDKDKYHEVDQSFSLPKNREKGLPRDEARQAFKSHYARLNNLDRARLPEEEKQLIDARKSNMFTAGKLYTQRQARTLGVDLSNGRKNRL